MNIIKNTNRKTKCAGILLALCAMVMLASCAAAPAGSGHVNASEPVAVPSDAGQVNTSEPVAAPSDAGQVNTSEPVAAPSDAGQVNTSEPVAAPSDAGQERTSEPVVAPAGSGHVNTAEPANTPSAEVREEAVPSETGGDEIDYVRFMKDPDYADHCIAEDIAKVAGLKSKPERYDSACVVDMRKSETAYDVNWDYGEEYEKQVALCDWEEVFDAEYYMEQFPMLALQYHYDEDQLLRHFQTVGIHEGRQGCEDFNVGAYMDWCEKNREYVVDLFEDDYAPYYMFYMSALSEQPEKFPADGHPEQYKAILTLAQQQELDGINSYRKLVSAEPLAFDSEMAAFANYRSWVNQEKEYTAHTWLHLDSSEDIINLYLDATSADRISENNLETSTLTVQSWYVIYGGSKPHYDAMVRPDYKYTGTSNLYVDDVAIKTYDNRGVQFDIFAGSLSTPFNP